MSLLSVFLFLLVVLLVAGVLLIDFLVPKKKGKISRQESNLQQGIEKIDSNVGSYDTLLKMAHSRISELEILVKNSENVSNSKEIVAKVSEINTKLYELEKFQQNTKIDMIALREIALEMKDYLDEQKSKHYLEELSKLREKNFSNPSPVGREM